MQNREPSGEHAELAAAKLAASDAGADVVTDVDVDVDADAALAAAAAIADAVAEIVQHDAVDAVNAVDAYLYGSVATGDYKRGWSDIDVLILTARQLTPGEAETLIELRQRMVNERKSGIYRSVEGAVLDADSFISGARSRVVYWGTSGERFADEYRLNSLSTLDLIEDGVRIRTSGHDVCDVRTLIVRPTYGELVADVKRHCESVRMCAPTMGRSLYSFGWMLDVARCIYTLRTGRIIPKTRAGEWALKEGICPCPSTLEFALRVRREPEAYLRDAGTLDYAATIGGDVLLFADVLDGEIAKCESRSAD